ncbi:hypothetical protein SEPCBS57363_005259 [Sporothrix epigloea]|uniref:NDT80 domain-containing protein n=1 Tax=Sporothrix epigloea TaxID=1892477 RepID=A0ABP0DWL0_9PEZI
MAGFSLMPALSTAGGTDDDALDLGATVIPITSASGFTYDACDQDIVFDDSLLNVDDLPLPFAPIYDFETFSTTFEDPFSYSVAGTGRPYELTPHNPEAFIHTTSPTAEGLDNKLLGFGKPIQKSGLVDDAGQICEPNMSAELFGMFFLAEDVYSAETTGRPLELTCYRRNLWWCSGQITLPRHITHIVTHEGRHMAVLELSASISALESIEKKVTDIVFIPWKVKTAKRAANSSEMPHEDANVAGPPRNVTIDIANGQELDNGCVSVPISWKRLQFKHATANNGRRKGQQQHYVVQINLLGRIQTDGDGDKGDSDWVDIAEIQSGPVIVRGRCPGNFIGLRDVPLTGNSTAADKKQLQPQPEHPSSLSLGGQDDTTDQAQDNSNVDGIDAENTFQQPDRSGPTTSAPIQARTRRRTQTQTQPPAAAQASTQPPKRSRPSKKVALSPSKTRPPIPALDGDIPGPKLKRARQQKQRTQEHQTQQQLVQQHKQVQQQTQYSSSAAVPLDLSVSEDERSSPNRMGTEPLSNSPLFDHLVTGSGGIETGGAGTPPIALPTTSTLSTPPVPAATVPATAAAAAARQNDFLEMDELLYEYFPLSLDDWMPPVDAIYRPHVVHHTVVPPEVKAQQIRSKTKRYFAAE